MKKKCGRTLEVLNRYKAYTILDYVRKGYQSVMRKVGNQAKNNKTYIGLLGELRDEDSERY